jgi:proteasome lid subunit RPN8/RPN11
MKPQPLSKELQNQLLHRARYQYPLEVCGFIMNSADPGSDMFLFDVPNVARNPRHNWRMDENWQRLAFFDEDNIVGIWHTHPVGPPQPSERDLDYRPPGLRCFVATRDEVIEYTANSDWSLAQ